MRRGCGARCRNETPSPCLPWPRRVVRACPLLRHGADDAQRRAAPFSRAVRAKRTRCAESCTRTVLRFPFSTLQTACGERARAKPPAGLGEQASRACVAGSGGEGRMRPRAAAAPPGPPRRALLLLLAARAGLRVGASFACDTSLAGRSAAVCAALGDLYSSAGGSAWSRSDSWSSAASGASPAPDYCAFYGVKCDANGLLTELCVCDALHTSPTHPDAPFARARQALAGQPAAWQPAGLRGQLDQPHGAGAWPARSARRSRAERPAAPSPVLPTCAAPPPAEPHPTPLPQDVSVNLLDDHVPPSLAALPALAYVDVRNNFLSGALPAFAASATLLLDKNGLDSASLPASTCAAACASAQAFACPWQGASAGCACPAAATPACRGSCSVQLSAANMSDLNLAGQCSSSANACYDCMTVVLAALLRNGIPLNGPEIGFCITATTAAYLQAGAQPAALNQLRFCQYDTAPVLAQTVTCPAVLSTTAAVAAFAPVAQNECNVARLGDSVALCTTCNGALQGVFIAAGCPKDYAHLAACMSSYVDSLFQAGFTPQVLARIVGCPSSDTPSAPAAASGSWRGGAIGGAIGGAALLAALAIGVRWRLRRRGQAAQLAAKGGKDVEQGSYVSVGGTNDTVTSSDSAGSNVPLPSSRSLLLRREDIELGDIIGQGGFATVHAARWSGTSVAVKVFRAIVFSPVDGPDAAASGPAGTTASFFGGLGNSSASGNSAPLRFLDSFFRMHGPGGGSAGDAAAGAACERELLLLASLRHPNIASMYGVVTTPPMLVLELCPGGSLLSLLQDSTLASLPWRRRLDIAVGVACGVEFLHAQQPPVIHRDLKSANVVLNEAQSPKLVDFGLSDLLPHASRDLAGASDGLQSLKGTAAFIAPELVMAATGAAVEDGTPQAIDMFGVGVVLHDLGHLGLSATERSRDDSAASSVDVTASGHLGSVQLLTQRLVTGFNVQVRDDQ